MYINANVRCQSYSAIKSITNESTKYNAHSTMEKLTNCSPETNLNLFTICYR